jgi:aspartyl-tRNA(Asn)/glutamyl-tRNA(Gln) amidotransferase subunit A
VLEPQLNAFITQTPEAALEAAQAAEAEIARGNYRGPLHGIPFAVKDIYDTANVLTSGHSRICIDRVPKRDATAVARLRAAGAVLTGKLATHEFAHGGPSFDLPWPPARNPWNTAHFTGGSSSGSGAALAAGLVPASLGSDTGGSTTRPIVDYAATLNLGIKGLRIGVIRHFWETDIKVHSELPAALETAIGILRDLGATVETVTMRPLRAYSDVKVVTAESELFSLHLPDLIARPQDFGQDFRARALAACLFTAEDYVRAGRERRSILAEMRPLYHRYDLFLTANGSSAPRLDKHDMLSFWRTPNLTSPFNCTGGPALAVLCGFTADGLPLSLQLAGRPFDDATVLRAGHAFEQATGLHNRRPALKDGAAPGAIDPKPWVPNTSDVPKHIRTLAEAAARLSGLKLPDQIMEELVAVAPLALAKARRLNRDHPREAEVCSIFDPIRDVY